MDDFLPDEVVYVRHPYTQCHFQEAMQTALPKINAFSESSLREDANSHTRQCKWMEIDRRQCNWIQIQGIFMKYFTFNGLFKWSWSIYDPQGDRLRIDCLHQLLSICIVSCGFASSSGNDTQERCVGQVTAPPSDLITVSADSVYVRFRKAPIPSGYGPIWSGFVYRKADCIRMRGNLERARQQQAARETTAGALHVDADSPLEPTGEEPPSCTA